MTLVIATFYKFVPVLDCTELQSKLLDYCQQAGIKGTILLASEGMNGTIAGSRSAIDSLLALLKADSRFADLEHKESFSEDYPFQRMKVKLKKEIVTFGKAEANPGVAVGMYVSPEQWNELITNPDVIVIDTRNQYEVTIGTFHGAINPQINSFREFPEYVRQNLNPVQHRKVAMFCTGGIRCEKASSYLLSQGFQNIYHLQGGILKYLETMPASKSLWQGECFVFDERVAVKHGLEPGSYAMCPSCGYPISEDDKVSPHYQAGVTCPHCYGR